MGNSICNVLYIGSVETERQLRSVACLVKPNSIEIHQIAGQLNARFAPPEHRPSAVLLEFGGATTTGFDLVQASLKQWPDAAVILLCPPDDEQAALEGLERGAQDWLATPVTDPHLLTTTLRRASARSRSGRALLYQHTLLRDLIDSLPDHVYAKDLDGRFIAANLGTVQAHGLSREQDLLGKTDFDLFPPQAAAAFQAEEEQLVRGELLVVDREAPIIDRDGRQTGSWSRTLKAVMWDAAGRAIGICGLNRDVTERRRVREQLEQTNVILAERQRELMAALANIEHDHEQLHNFQLKLVQSEKMESIGRLAAGVAHEVKNPLAIIMMALEYLTRCDHKTTDLSPVLQTMSRAARRADSVVRGLMDFAAPGTMRLAAASPAELVRNSIQMVRHEMTRAHVQSHVDVPETVPAACVDVSKIEQVLVNLFMNAIQAMPKGGTLSVRAESGSVPDCLNDGRSRYAGLFQPGDKIVIIEIEDTGSGIPEEHIPRLFEPFFTTKPKGQGNGLGLTVIKTIMDLHGGGIDIRNRAGGGVQATLLLKASAPDQCG